MSTQNVSPTANTAQIAIFLYSLRTHGLLQQNKDLQGRQTIGTLHCTAVVTRHVKQGRFLATKVTQVRCRPYRPLATIRATETSVHACLSTTTNDKRVRSYTFRILQTSDQHQLRVTSRGGYGGGWGGCSRKLRSSRLRLILLIVPRHVDTRLVK
jgi:hypothetical protein